MTKKGRHMTDGDCRAYTRSRPPFPFMDRDALMSTEYESPVTAAIERAKRFAGSYRAQGDAYAQRGDLRAAGVCEDAASDFERLARAAENAAKGERL